MTQNNIHPTALGVLEATPSILRSMFGGATAESAHEQRDDGWSAKGVLAHVVDIERGSIAERVRRIISEDRPFIRSIDPHTRLRDGGFATRTVDSLLDELSELRPPHVAWLRTLDPSQLERGGQHDEAGEITAGNIAHQWAYHDLMHIKQIASMLQAGLVEHMGNTRRFYDI